MFFSSSSVGGYSRFCPTFWCYVGHGALFLLLVFDCSIYRDPLSGGISLGENQATESLQNILVAVCVAVKTRESLDKEIDRSVESHS